MKPQLRCVLFDLGGVLTPDPWEALVLTPDAGVADRLGVPTAHAAAAGEALWPTYAVADAAEADYWSELAGLLGVTIGAALVAEVESAVLYANPDTDRLVDGYARRGARIGVISNNTAFWWPKQRALTGLDRWLDPDLVFLSQERGCQKSAGLFELAAAELAETGTLDAAATLVLDDRPPNVDRARSAGFEAVHYQMG